MCTCEEMSESPMCPWCNARADEAADARAEEWDGDESPRHYPESKEKT